MQAGPLALEGFSFYLSLGLHTAAFFFLKIRGNVLFIMPIKIC